MMPNLTQPILSNLMLPSLLALGVVVRFVLKWFFLKVLSAAAKKTKTKWDDELVAAGVFSRLATISLPLAMLLGLEFVQSQATYSSWVTEWLPKALECWLVFVAVRVLDALLNSMVAVWDSNETNRTRPIRAYTQVLKIVVWLFAAILMISFLLDESPWALMGGLAGAMTVLLLVFKDSIMGLVASVQLSNYDLVRVGDWIEVSSYGADGDVLEVNLHTVKVQNWDKTITTLPTTALVTGGFKNWRGMSESTGRRIKRSLSIDMRSIKFLDNESLQSLKKIQFIQDYLDKKIEELGAWNQQQQVDETSLVNGRRLTNLGTFRAYVEAYLAKHPQISKEMTFLVRQLRPTEKGLPIQIYVFSTEQRWVQYEAIISDLFDHFIAVLPEFGLRVFQNPTGSDFRRLVESD